MPEFASQVLGFMRFRGMNRNTFRLVRATALQSALQLYSKIVVGSVNAFNLYFISSVFHLITHLCSFCIYFDYLLQVFLHFM